MKKNIPVFAIMNDFDKTLCTKDMQEYTFIPKVGLTAEQFWSEANVLAKKKKMDKILAYMYLMLDKSHLAKKSIRREDFVTLGKDLEFFPGVIDWFDRINKIGKNLGVKIEHYIISSGLKEIIEGSTIYKNFKEVFASEFLYDENALACWPKNAVNYTTKTQFLFRINKGVLDISNDNDLNEYKKEDERPIPFRNMIYLGDGMTDVPCMKLVKANGGYSIAVYAKEKKASVKSLIENERVNFIAFSDYSKNSELETIVSNILSKMAMTEILKNHTKKQLKDLNLNKENY